jgi:hypothetical protein
MEIVPKLPKGLADVKKYMCFSETYETKFT